MTTLNCSRATVLAQEENLPDIQAEADSRGVALESAGVSGIKLPITIVDVDQECARTILEASAGVSVRATERGAHMSRLVDEIQGMESALRLNQLSRLHLRLLDRSHASTAKLQLSFPWFISKPAPVSGIRSTVDLLASYSISGGRNSRPILKQRLQVPVTTLCPCSKAISRHGAHNQRTLVTVKLEVESWIPIGELTQIIEAQASCEVYGTLKRIDEKYVTEKAYENPRFVEDLARDIALSLKSEKRILDSRIEVESIESIHNHQAFAVVTQPGTTPYLSKRPTSASETFLHSAAIQD